MILVCSQCNSRYLVPDTAIGAAGRTVRCANCSHTWFQSLPKPEAAPEPAPESMEQILNSIKEAIEHETIEDTTPPEPVKKHPLPFGSNLPVIITVRKTPTSLKVFCVLMALLSAALYLLVHRDEILNNYPNMAFMLKPFGIYYTQGLALADVNISKTPNAEGTITSIKVECSVVNESKEERILSPVKVRVLNASGAIINSSDGLVETGKNIKSGEVLPCKPFEFQSKGEAEKIQIDLANTFNQMIQRTLIK